MTDFLVGARFMLRVTADDAKDAQAAVLDMGNEDLPHVANVERVEVFYLAVYPEPADD